MSAPWALMALLQLGGAGALAEAEAKGPVVIPDPPKAGPQKGARRALVLGVTAFKDPRWPALRFTGHDAKDMERALGLGGFQLEPSPLPSQAGLKQALAALGRDSRPEDVLLVYVSSHGTLSHAPDGSLEQVLVLEDTDHEHPFQTGLALRELLSTFDRLPSERKVLILATCYSGAGKSSVSEALAREISGLKGALAPPLYQVSKATIVLSAASFGEPAREDEQLGHDIYTHYLLEALRGYDPNRDGATSVSEAHDYARAQTYRHSRGAQRPTALMHVVGEDPIILSGERKSPGDPMLTSYGAGLTGYRVVVDGVEKGELPGGIAVEPGWREVVLLAPRGIPGSEALARQKIRVGEGEWIDLAGLVDREPPVQLELQAGALFRPGSVHGSSLVVLGGLGVLARAQDLLLGLDASALFLTGLGHDVLTINQERFDAALWEARAALGAGLHFDLGGPIWHVDAMGGVAHLRRAVDSPLFLSPQVEWLATAGIRTELRFRLGDPFSLGVAVAAEALFASDVRFAGSTWLLGAISL